MDNITKSYLENFITKFGFNSNISESEAFEHFSSFTILSQEVNNNLLKSDLESISVGQAKGVDTIAFCINEKLIINSDEIENYQNQGLRIDAFFIQSKTSENFDDKELGNFLDVVIDFFSDNPQYNIKEFENQREIYKKLLDKLANIRGFNLHCLYVSLGQKQELNNTLYGTIKIKETVLKQYNLFGDIEIKLIDKSTLLNLHKKAISPLSATFKFENKIQLTGIPDVDEAYIGFIPFSEFKNLIIDENNNKIKSLFNDNLRDFLGFENPINQGIKKTLEDKKFNEFSLLNNGVTVIAESNIGKGNTLILENYQIVNGCQTSNVLYECRNISDIEKVIIPLKVVITKNETLRDNIILTTNSQSIITEEQLFAITSFQKTLEDEYKANIKIDNIYYERRTNQFYSNNISRTQIVDIKEQLKSFMAMFFDIPHLVAGNIGKVVSIYKGKFFQKEHHPMPYYISGLLSKKWDKMLLSDEKYKDFNKYRYHIFMGFRYLVEDLPFNQEFLKNIKNYSIKIDSKRENSYDKLLNTIRNENELVKTIDLAINILKKVEYNRPKGAYSNPITQEYIKYLQEYINSDGDSDKIEK